MIEQKKREKIVRTIPSDEQIRKICHEFKFFNDPSKVKIVLLLSKSELNVSEICSMMHITHSAVSHQLRALRYKKLVKFRKEGNEVYYSIADKRLLKIILKILALV